MNKLFIIDMMPFLYKGHFVFLRNPRMTSSGINTSALLGLANGLMSILKKECPTHMVLAMDPGGPTFRHEAYPPYKAQRQKMPEDLAASIPYAFELAEALRIPVVRVDGFEADDVMGTLAVKGAAAGFDVYVATPDKDAAQLVRQGVRLSRPARAGEEAEIYDAAKVCEHWHLREPKQMIDYLSLQYRVAKTVRGIDPDTPIIIESNGWDSPTDFAYLTPLPMKDIIYQGVYTKYWLDSCGKRVQALKPHSRFLLDQETITWNDKVFMWWHPDDGYMVEDSVSNENVR